MTLTLHAVQSTHTRGENDAIIFATNENNVLHELRHKKEVDLYSAFVVVPHTQGDQVRIIQFYLQITP